MSALADTTQNDAYMIVRDPGEMLRQYARSATAQLNAGPLRELREAFCTFDPTCYRGISRYPLQAYPSGEEKIIKEFAATGIDMKSDSRARKRFFEIVENRPDDLETDLDHLVLLPEAQEVRLLTDDPGRWEIIHISRGEAVAVGALLGYDLGYWGGDHYSLIADTIVIPHWHPPASEDLTVLAETLSRLNKHLLFDSESDAAEFKRYYSSKSWAETENYDGEFCCIRVCSVG